MKDYDWFFYILGGLLVLWFVLGGPSRAKEDGGRFPIIDALRTSTRSTSTSSSASSRTKTETPAAAKKRIARELRDIEREVDDVARAIQKIKEEQESSPLKDKVRLSRASAGSQKPAEEYLTITISSNLPEDVLVSGWKLTSPITGKAITIGNGTRIPYSGRVNSEEPIVASPGDRLLVTTGRSPIGTSFRINQCTGYFEQYQDFKPALKRVCPSPDEDVIYNPQAGINDSCMDYLERLSSCMMPGSQPAGLSSECYAYVTEKINYSGCVATHKNDPDFYDDEWRIFLGRSEELWKKEREVIQLLDQNGKTIDSIDY